MAIEAIYQTSFMTTWNSSVPLKYRYALRDIWFLRALVLEQDEKNMLMLSLNAVPSSTSPWYSFKVFSVKDDIWTDHASGFIRLETDYVSDTEKLPNLAVSVAYSEYVGVGRSELPYNYSSSCKVYDPTSRKQLLHMKGLRYRELDSAQETTLTHNYMHLAYDADIPLLSGDGFQILEAMASAGASAAQANSHVAHWLIDLVTHKKPTLRVLEVNVGKDDATSLWLDNGRQGNDIRSAFDYYRFLSPGTDSVVAAQVAYASASGRTEFTMADLTRAEAEMDDKFDLAIIKLPQSQLENSLEMVLRRFCSVVQPLDDPFDSLDTALKAAGFSHRPCRFDGVTTKGIHCLPSGPTAMQHSDDTDSAFYNGYDLRHEALSDATFEGPQWQLLQDLVDKQCNILWVTSGAQEIVIDPNKAAITGIFRVIRNEEPLLRLINLDVEHLSGRATVRVVEACLKMLSEEQIKAVFATVGTQKKRDFLKSTFGIPDERIFSSRSTAFAGHITKLTNGEGSMSS
ncbi:hypothetical protein B0I35DRAFT_414481 [Stachybotrys elegans]|uniref:Uncharacterized protein n=1 Tax=Stachybotrys elegans TaxID=80388 RepID=A0A8K0SFE0_9HYPO|nr:hypothetical protein B0I35DRAFT_414481 [Stachybotrys elegans]